MPDIGKEEEYKKEIAKLKEELESGKRNDNLLNAMGQWVASPECECEIEKWQDEMNDDFMRRQMKEYFDDNGDPRRDFLGNPW